MNAYYVPEDWQYFVIRVLQKQWEMDYVHSSLDMSHYNYSYP